MIVYWHIYILQVYMIDSQLIHIRFQMKMNKVPMLTFLSTSPNNIKTINLGRPRKPMAKKRSLYLIFAWNNILIVSVL